MVTSNGMKMLALVCCLCVSGVAAQSPAQNAPIRIHSGFLSGEEFLNLGPGERWVYVEGLIDGIFLAPLYGAPKERVKVVEDCVVGMTNHQIAAMLEKYLRDRPEIWNEGAHTVASRMLFVKCNER